MSTSNSISESLVVMNAFNKNTSQMSDLMLEEEPPVEPVPDRSRKSKMSHDFVIPPIGAAGTSVS
jgi:hypothetical protein